MKKLLKNIEESIIIKKKFEKLRGGEFMDGCDRLGRSIKLGALFYDNTTQPDI